MTDLVVQLCSNLDELFGQMWTGEDKMDVLRHELGSKKKSNCEVLTRGIFQKTFSMHLALEML